VRRRREEEAGAAGTGIDRGVSSGGRRRMLCLFPLRPDVDATEVQAFLDQCMPELAAFVETPRQPLFVPPPLHPGKSAPPATVEPES